MGIADRIRTSSAHRYAVVGETVWQLRRVTSEELRQAGLVDLLPVASASEALTSAQRDAAEARRGHSERAKAARASEEARDAQRAADALSAQLATPEGTLAHLARMDALVIAAVTGAGKLRHDAPEVPTTQGIGLLELLPPGARLAHYTDQIEPIRVVAHMSEESDAAVCVDRLDPSVRIALGMAAATVQDVSQEVAPFRRGTGAPDDTTPRRE